VQFHLKSCLLLLLYGLLFGSPPLPAQEVPGSLDPLFFTDGGADATIHAIAIQSDGKIVIGGDFNSYYQVPNRAIARILPNGSSDSTFTSPITDPAAQVSAIAIQSDGQIVVGLEATLPLLRLNSSGTVDSAFNINIGSGPDGGVHAIAFQTDGKILIGGEFTHVNGSARGRIARLNKDGTLDGTFTPGAGADYTIEVIVPLADGKIYVGGQFHTYRQISRNGIARLNSDGSLDATFTPGQGANYPVYSMAIQTDGKPIIGGFFTLFDGHPQNAVARLNTNGTYDATFQSLSLLEDGTVFAMQLQADGKLVVAGDMTQAHLVRLNTDGSQDTTYQPGLGPSDDVYAMAIQRDQKVVIGGLFVAMDLTPANFIARLNADLKLLSSSKAGSIFTSQIQTTSGRSYKLQYKTDFGQPNWIDVTGSDVVGDGTVKTIRDNSAGGQQRFYRVNGFAD
jgi:uncharacterized delta-60 repeat protein